MKRVDVLVPRYKKQPCRFRFNLRVLLAFMAVASILIGLWLRPRPCYVELLLHFDPSRAQLIWPDLFTAKDYAEMFQSHLDLFESDKVLAAAIRDPAVASISIIQTQDDPVSWIRTHLQVSRQREPWLVVADRTGGVVAQEARLLSLRIDCTQYGIRACRKIIEAVLNAYESEVAAKQRMAIVNSVTRAKDTGWQPSVHRIRLKNSSEKLIQGRDPSLRRELGPF
jgi:hypothetical protein